MESFNPLWITTFLRFFFQTSFWESLQIGAMNALLSSWKIRSQVRFPISSMQGYLFLWFYFVLMTRRCSKLKNCPNAIWVKMTTYFENGQWVGNSKDPDCTDPKAWIRRTGRSSTKNSKSNEWFLRRKKLRPHKNWH